MTETKSSRKSTTKDKDSPVPEYVNWLLGFFNVNSRAGEYNPKKLRFPRELNRTPTIPPDSTFNHETGYDGITEKGYVYVSDFSNEPLCVGKENFFPTASDFRKYFENTKIGNAAIVENEEMFQRISWLWNDLSMAFARIAGANQLDIEKLLFKRQDIDIDEEQEIAQSIIESHCRSYLDNYDLEVQLRIERGEWIPDIKKIPDVIYIGILTWIKCKELHELLRQCPCCGAFRIQQKQKGKPRVFCKNTSCEDTFNSQSREKDIEANVRSRKHKRGKEKPKIIKYIMETRSDKKWDDNLGRYVFKTVDEERAEEIFDEVDQRSQNNTSSLTEFIRTEG